MESWGITGKMNSRLLLSHGDKRQTLRKPFVVRLRIRSLHRPATPAFMIKPRLLGHQAPWFQGIMNVSNLALAMMFPLAGDLSPVLRHIRSGAVLALHCKSARLSEILARPLRLAVRLSVAWPSCICSRTFQLIRSKSFDM